MSKIIASQTYLIATVLGNIAVKSDLIEGYDVEDIIHNRGESQGRVLQMLNVGNNLDPNAVLPTQALPSLFTNQGAVLSG